MSWAVGRPAWTGRELGSHRRDYRVDLVGFGVELSASSGMLTGGALPFGGALCVTLSGVDGRGKIGWPDRASDQPDEVADWIALRCRVGCARACLTAVSIDPIEDLLACPAAFDEPLPLQSIAQMSNVPPVSAQPGHAPG